MSRINNYEMVLIRSTLTLSTFVFFFVALLRFAAASPSVCDGIAGNLVANCGFETGSFTSWTHTGNTVFTDVTTSASYVHSGADGARLGPVNNDGFLSQVLPTIPGGTYDLQFWLKNDLDCCPNDFSVSWNGTTLYSVTDIPGFDWTLHDIFGLVATGGDTLKFAFRQNPSNFGLDDISVTQISVPRTSSVPEPGSLVLMGTGLLGVAGMVRRKLVGGR